MPCFFVVFSYLFFNEVSYLTGKKEKKKEKTKKRIILDSDIMGIFLELSKLSRLSDFSKSNLNSLPGLWKENDVFALPPQRKPWHPCPDCQPQSNELPIQAGLTNQLNW